MPRCSFCDRDPTYGPYGTVSVCEPCRQHIGALACSDQGDGIWLKGKSTGVAEPTEHEALENLKAGAHKPLSLFDADVHVNLALAYRDMELYADARYEVAILLAYAGERTDDALRILLTDPLLRSGGVDKLRSRLTRN